MKIDDKYMDIPGRRKEFPALSREHNGYPLAFFDGPGGTQVPQAVIDAVVSYYCTCNSNTHGFFVTTNESDRLLEGAREAMASFLGAGGARNISFGHNMTTLNYTLSRGIGKALFPGDEILITQLDHEANRGPWLSLREEGVVVREVALLPDGTLDYDDLRTKINENTRLVAMGFSSNALGTVNEVGLVRELTHKVGAWLLVDAVHYAPHFPIDVNALGVDFLLCSAYKFYGTHIGILYSRDGLLDRIPVYTLRTQEQHAPYCIETGTLNHAAIAGVKAAVEYISTFGTGETLRARIVSGMERIGEYEHILGREIYRGLKGIKGVEVVGPDFGKGKRVPTVSFTMEGMDPIDVCTLLDRRGICAWDGHFYAVRPIEVLGLLEKGGVTRVGVSLYNTADEVQRLLEAVTDIAEGKLRKE
ncbi:MAG TPA: cysteine desulfurase-like protein [Synergistales bacterium]|nr:cysteine desulfurase-like protein [Synergistales bacterium]HQQ09867.1 cysteine desulfurase-like protein [Synergistales bacterium]